MSDEFHGPADGYPDNPVLFVDPPVAVEDGVFLAPHLREIFRRIHLEPGLGRELAGLGRRGRGAEFRLGLGKGGEQPPHEQQDHDKGDYESNDKPGNGADVRVALLVSGAGVDSDLVTGIQG